MEDTGAVAAAPAPAPAPAAASISAEIDSLFADAGSESTPVETSAPESTTTETAPAANPQDSTVQPPSPEDFEPEAPTPAEEDAVPAAKAEPAVEAAPPVSEEDREGEEYEVRGKKWIRYPEARGKEVYAGYQAAKTLSKELGLPGPVTPETIRTLASDKQLLDSIDFDVMSNDPAEQARAFRYLFATAKKAHDQGHAGHNPHATMADALLYAASQAAPDVIDGLERRITQETFNRLYQKAVNAGIETDEGRALLSSVQRAEQALTGNFRKKAELAQMQKVKVDPLAERQAALDTKARDIEAYEQNRAQQEWDAWATGTKASIESGLQASISTILKPVLASLKNFPETQKNVELRLRQELIDAFVSDKRFAAEREKYYKQASIAGTEQVRDGWRARITQMYTVKADQVLREKAPAILSESATAVKAKSDSTHRRLASTQQLRGTPAGGIAPNGTAAPSPGNGKFDSRSWAAELESAFN